MPVGMRQECMVVTDRMKGVVNFTLDTLLGFVLVVSLFTGVMMFVPVLVAFILWDFSMVFNTLDWGLFWAFFRVFCLVGLLVGMGFAANEFSNGVKKWLN